MELSQFTFYNHLSPELQMFVQKNSRAVQVPKNTILFYQGEICKDILFLSEGNIRLYIQEKQFYYFALYLL